MPNTLAHLGVQGLVTRGLVPDADLKWIALGCVIPDLPWIGVRVLNLLVSDLPHYDVRLYAIVQCSLALSLVLAAGAAAFATRPKRVFGVLALGCLLHLALDAVQTKWGNGVHLFAPFSWELLNLGWFWPEDVASHALTALGLVFLIVSAWRLPVRGDDLVWPVGRRAALAGSLLSLYVALPLGWISAAEGSDSHFVRTLRVHAERPGKPVAFDRNFHGRDAQGSYLDTFTGERLRLEGADPDRIGKVSLRGRFLDAETVQVSALHVHPPYLRDAASYLGLAGIALVWARALWTRVGSGSLARRPGR